jgi:hypothetical protein
MLFPDDFCGCGTRQCKPWATPTPNFHCGAPPSPPPLCYCEECPGQPDTKLIPVWHPVHPLIPMAKLQCNGLIERLLLCSEAAENEIEAALGAQLLSAELNTSTCGFPGDRYFQGVILFAAAQLELRFDHDQWMSSRMAMSANGNNFTMPAPQLSNQPSWQLREHLKVKRTINFSNAYRGGRIGH